MATRAIAGFTIFACALTIWKRCSFIKDHDQGYPAAINDNFSRVSKIHRHPAGNVALDLPGAPFGMLRVPNKHAGAEDSVQIVHDDPLLEQETLDATEQPQYRSPHWQPHLP